MIELARERHKPVLISIWFSKKIIDHVFGIENQAGSLRKHRKKISDVLAYCDLSAPIDKHWPRHNMIDRADEQDVTQL